ncbi:bifunctional DNA primase/polymerase [Actinomycetospora termitidis]|uniref:Bifunctional DNA primase/polymerase n=1 Tax=Actinomycetospora termitidis TaxID=3053470 RepID=A0ABT7M1F7_9PSEU|nr:bifunctional DNA primase/polymerase [Actinomycetospora sp. Odt1-22]MDL5154488.1 bifunctional DNA primase/polymerase [Actinomycetospora sp. Odt1-22]
MQWWDSYRAVYGTELRAEAMVLADHGWAVVPGTFPQGEVWTGRADAPQAGPVPVLDDWAAKATTDVAQIADWWSGLPYSILLPTGITFDVIEVPASIGRRAAAALRSVGEPVAIAATPTGEWLFPVMPGEPLRPDLAGRPGTALHGRGSYFAAPPSTFPQGSIHWRVRPAACGWRLPDPYSVQDAMAEAVRERPLRGLGGSSTYRLASVATGIRS